MKKGAGIKIIIIGAVLAVLVVGYFFYLSRKVEDREEETVESTAVQLVLNRDLTKSYPPSPNEVVRYFNDVTQCFYNESYTDDELYDLAMKIQEVYDDELIANKTQDQYLEDLKSDIAVMKANDRSVSSYELYASTDVDFFTENDDNCARLYCTYNIREGTKMLKSMVVFILRQDEDEHWKIMGWDKAD